MGAKQRGLQSEKHGASRSANQRREIPVYLSDSKEYFGDGTLSRVEVSAPESKGRR